MDTKEYYLDAFVDYLNKSDKSSGTILTYTANIKGFIKYYVESYGEEFIPENVIMMDLRNYRNYLLNIKRQKASTINNKIASLKEYFFFLMSNSIIKTNPAENLKKIRTNKPVAPKSFSDTEFKKIKRYVYRSQKDLWIVVFELLSKTGVRVSELINIRLADITINERSGNLRVIGKNQKERNIPLHLDVRKAITAYMEVRDRMSISSDYLLISERKRPFTRSGIFKMLKRWENDTNIKIHPHMFRHHFAIQVLNTPNADINTVQYLLGHESIESSAIYLKVRQEDLEESINAISDY
ncbi:tyrosine-type recombinase/integrase [Petroclostridium xylanilyticum]|uniref:tyrosine-type recombinase/integrase n=1 Tax=Petroclostridium xylanilyticum TaxID=1792311 RepID=UPI0018E2BCA9|nr:tyrosine-type recombinase/integrase [Petroclostridium xylanilyticum]